MVRVRIPFCNRSMPLGKEGPFVHVGAIVGALLGEGGAGSYHLPWRWLAAFRNDRDRRDLVTLGCGAGVAGAFR